MSRYYPLIVAVVTVLMYGGACWWFHSAGLLVLSVVCLIGTYIGCELCWREFVKLRNRRRR